MAVSIVCELHVGLFLIFTLFPNQMRHDSSNDSRSLCGRALSDKSISL